MKSPILFVLLSLFFCCQSKLCTLVFVVFSVSIFSYEIHLNKFFLFEILDLHILLLDLTSHQLDLQLCAITEVRPFDKAVERFIIVCFFFV